MCWMKARFNQEVGTAGRLQAAFVERRTRQPFLSICWLKHGIAFGRFGRHTSHHHRRLRRHPKIPGCLKRTPDIGIFRPAIEGNQLHAMRALHLIAVPESWRPLAEGLPALGTHNFNSVGHEIFLPSLISEDHAKPLFIAPDDVAMMPFTAADNVQRDFVRNASRARYVECRADWGYVANCAIDTAAVELDRSGFENALSRLCAALFHAAASKTNV
jgi:hypothetical protein